MTVALLLAITPSAAHAATTRTCSINGRFGILDSVCTAGTVGLFPEGFISYSFFSNPECDINWEIIRASRTASGGVEWYTVASGTATSRNSNLWYSSYRTIGFDLKITRSNRWGSCHAWAAITGR
jgi:hypothetical protein